MVVVHAVSLASAIWLALFMCVPWGASLALVSAYPHAQTRVNNPTSKLTRSHRAEVCAPLQSVHIWRVPAEHAAVCLLHASAQVLLAVRGFCCAAFLQLGVGAFYHL